MILRKLGLGCMRLSTAPDRDADRGVAVIRTALDMGVTLLDTADSYCHDENDTGHNERLVARALEGWGGDRARITIATKGGMRRPNGAWVADGRAKHLRDACDASRRALGVETLDLYQLHGVDPRTPLETSVRALARLQDEGKIRDVGLCNVTVSQIRAAQTIVTVGSVQASLSPFDDENLRNGVAEYCRDNGIQLIAYRPLGGERRRQLGRDGTLARIAANRGVTNEAIVLAWLVGFQGMVPIPGATRVETAAALATVFDVDLDDDDRRALDASFSGRLLRVPRTQRRPPSDAAGEVVIVMGMPGAGKSTIARALVADGYERLNRDSLGGSLAVLASRLDDVLAQDKRHVVLDNTYPTRKSRNEVIETAWQRGVPVRCVWLTTSVADAQINSIRRMLDVHGRLPTPEEIRERGKSDPRFLLPDAQFRYERTLEPPSMDEGFVAVEERAFVREPDSASARALILDADDPRLAARGDVLRSYRDDDWLTFLHAWRPGATPSDADASFARLRETLGDEIDVACCVHEAGPPVCWCRKPIPGSLLDFARRRKIALSQCVVVGTSAADRTIAERIGARFEPSASFFE
ncbi:MAG TPA: aldo/keto reductase [Gemmatimonadaceae bacterium]|jgi:aryl-alcohol dehydrogenase-like predicted oxidoreductase/predicted kinase